MGYKTEIAWTESTWSPWIGCDKVSPGCARCYAERLWQRFAHDFSRLRPTAKIAAPLAWRKPKLVFTCSMSDFFHEAADQWREEAWSVIRRTPRHAYQILTKRPERIAGHLPLDWPLPNVWLGVSAEYQRWLDARCRYLIGVDVPVRFVSCEPLLGPLDLTYWLAMGTVNWVIVGGESGPGGRPLKLEWVETIIAQCRSAGVACFVKQLGAAWAKSARARDAKGAEPAEWPAELRVREWPQLLAEAEYQERMVL